MTPPFDYLISAGETGAVVPKTTPYIIIRHDVIEPFSWAENVYSGE